MYSTLRVSFSVILVISCTLKHYSQSSDSWTACKDLLCIASVSVQTDKTEHIVHVISKVTCHQLQITINFSFSSSQVHNICLPVGKVKIEIRIGYEAIQFIGPIILSICYSSTTWSLSYSPFSKSSILCNYMIPCDCTVMQYNKLTNGMDYIIHIPQLQEREICVLVDLQTIVAREVLLVTGVDLLFAHF